MTNSGVVTLSAPPNHTFGDNLKPELWGPPAWRYLHLWAEAMPTTMNRDQQINVIKFLEKFASWLPCTSCRYHFWHAIRSRNPEIGLWEYVPGSKDERAHPRGRWVGGREQLTRWLIDRHNDVNRRLGKPVLDYTEARTALVTDESLTAEMFPAKGPARSWAIAATAMLVLGVLMVALSVGLIVMANPGKIPKK